MENEVKMETIQEVEDLLKQEDDLVVEDVPETVDINTLKTVTDDLQTGLTSFEDIKKTVQCSLCKAYVDAEDIDVHEKIHVADKTCLVCNKTFRNRNGNMSHMFTHLKIKPYGCEFCDKTFAARPELKLHIRVHTNERPYKCNVCEKAFKQRGARKDHMLTHSAEKPLHPCEQCDGKFSTLSSLRRHLKRIHEKGKSFDCYLCETKPIFYNITSYREHRRQYHPESEFNRICPVCEKSFNSKCKYAKHKESHLTQENTAEDKEILSILQQNFNCYLCGEVFKTSLEYQQHQDAHLGIDEGKNSNLIEVTQKYKCKVCNKEMESKKKMFYHIDTHMDKKYKCIPCNKDFTYAGLMKHNKKVHKTYEHKTWQTKHSGTDSSPKTDREATKKFSCQKCLCAFNSKHFLKLHNRMKHIAKKVRIFKCSACGKMFLYIFNIQRHLLSRHSANSKCKICNIKFESKDKLHDHISMHFTEIKDELRNTTGKTQMGITRVVKSKSTQQSCKMCNITVPSRYKLDMHMKTHQKGFYQCSFCKKHFRFFKNLLIHLKVNVCQKQNLNDLKCFICRKNFDSLDELMGHMNKYTSRKNIVCQICKAKFYYLIRLKKHIDTYHSVGLVDFCVKCGTSLDSVDQWQKHFQLKHKNMHATSQEEEVGVKDEVKEEPTEFEPL